jgi:hypothetical protein
MNRLFLSCVFVFSVVPSLASDFGTTGLIDIPTARMSSDGTLTTTAAIQSRTKSYSISYQAMPWFEGTFRYTGFNRAIYSYDRNYEAKIRLWNEQGLIPQVAVGIRDLVGTGLWGSEYLVASKKVGDFDVTLGIGWGRLAGKGNFENPMIRLSDKFLTRDYDTGLGGELASANFFSGEEVGLFGGIRYQVPTLPLTAIMEYNPDKYDFSFNRGGERPSSPITAAVKWDALPGVSLTVSHQHNQEWGIELSAAIDTKTLPLKPKNRVFRSSLDYSADQLPLGINPTSWYDTLLFDVERSGILLLEATLDSASQSATIVMGNTSYVVSADAVATMVNLADLHLPANVQTFNIVIEEEGHRLHSIAMQRPSIANGRTSQLIEREIRLQPVKPLNFVQHKTNFVQKKILFDVNLAHRLQLFDPDDPARYQLYTKVGMRLALPKSWLLSGAYGANITHNFDESNRVSNSVLTRVRTDVVKYLTEGESGLDSLYLEKRGTAKKDVHYRVFAGVLESMYSGIGGEVLYQPYQSRFAYGLSANWVQQRDYDKSFKHLDYKTDTAFASIYWASPFYNFDVAVHAGKYLAKDKGATLEVRRTFHNGWSVGLWATKTNVSAEDFGEGSFDKGMYFKIPLNGIFGASNRSNYTNRLRPIQRDGGQRLEDFSANIWWDTRAVRYDALSETINRISQ